MRGRSFIAVRCDVFHVLAATRRFTLCCLPRTDLKPENILVKNPAGRASPKLVLVDFGVRGSCMAVVLGLPASSLQPLPGSLPKRWETKP